MSGLAVKTLSEVEVNSLVSNQHEFNGVNQLKEIFGTRKLVNLAGRFIYMSNNGIECEATGLLTWYDARERHPTRSEYRLYYGSSLPLQKASAGDTLLITIDDSGWVNVIIIARGTQLANFLISQIGRIGQDYRIVTDSYYIKAVENAIPPM